MAKRYPHLYQRDIEVLVNTMFDEMTKALSEGNRVELRGFGSARQGQRVAHLQEQKLPRIAVVDPAATTIVKTHGEVTAAARAARLRTLGFD